MMFLPVGILGIWFRALLAPAILAGGAYLLYRAYDHAHVREAAPVAERPGDGPRADAPARRAFRPDFGWNRQTAELLGGLALLAWGLGGLPIVKGLERLRLRRGDDEPNPDRGGEVHRLRRPDGRELHVEIYGPADAPPVVLTHGWGANGTEWYYTKKALAGRCRLIVWDEPGLGLSRKPDNNDYALESMARDLDAVLGLAGGRPAVLVGHSIGGMIILTFCRLAPEALGTRVAGLVLVHTTYTNPVRTTSMAGLYTALEAPLIVPLCRLTIALWPVMWALSWLSYLNGSAHSSSHREAFAGTETRGQLEFTARFQPHGRPDVLARGMLGMIHYDATAALKSIAVPTLVVAGDRDISTTPEASERIARDVPGARLLTLSPARHMGLIERHEDFDRAVADFVDSCQGAGVAGGVAG